MSTPYTEAEIWVKIRALDTEIETLRAKLLNYGVGSKRVDQDRRLELMLKHREQLVTMAEKIGGLGVAEQMVITDYEMDRFGNQLGQTQDGDD